MRPATASSQHVSTLRDYVAVVRRRKLVVIAVVVVLTAAAGVLSHRQQAMYESTAQVLLSSGDLGAALTNTPAANGNDTPDRLAQTQADLARVPSVAQRAVQALRNPIDAGTLLAESSVTAASNSNILDFAVHDHDRRLAQRLATAYARAYIRYRLAVETAGLAVARKDLEQRIKETPAGALHTSLVEKDQTLQELAALKTADASVVRTGSSAVQTAPKTERNVLLAFILSAFLGIGLAILRESLDTRVRSADDVATHLELPVLARLSQPSRRLRTSGRLAMLDDPASNQAEAFRMLRANLEFVSLGRAPRVLMITSALEKEGKSTTIANLAVALARAGQRVILVDLDLRRPAVDRFFNLREFGGVTQVALRHLGLEEALSTVPVDVFEPAGIALTSVVTVDRHIRISDNGHARAQASLRVLPAGPLPPDPGEFVATSRVGGIIDDLRDMADIVLVDAPPLFHVGDALTLSSKVDSVLVVTRMEAVRKPMLDELRRLLDLMPAQKLGVVITAAEDEERYYYHSDYTRGNEAARSS